MEFRDVVRRRRMVRRFADEPVAPEVLTRVVHDATRAPSAGFTQAVEFLLLDVPAQTSRFWAATSDPDVSNTWLDGMRTAPVLVIPVTSKAAYLQRYAQPDKGWDDRAQDRWPVPWWYVDAGMSVLLVLQGAVDAGLGACFFGIPSDRMAAVVAAFAIPAAHEPIGAIALGHRDPRDSGPGGSPRRRARRDPESQIHRGGW